MYVIKQKFVYLDTYTPTQHVQHVLLYQELLSPFIIIIFRICCIPYFIKISKNTKYQIHFFLFFFFWNGWFDIKSSFGKFCFHCLTPVFPRVRYLFGEQCLDRDSVFYSRKKNTAFSERLWTRISKTAFSLSPGWNLEPCSKKEKSPIQWIFQRKLPNGL